MKKVDLSLLDTDIANELAKSRGVSVDDLVSNLLREEAAVEIAGWRKKIQQSKKIKGCEGKEKCWGITRL